MRVTCDCLAQTVAMLVQHCFCKAAARRFGRIRENKTSHAGGLMRNWNGYCQRRIANNRQRNDPRLIPQKQAA